MICHTVQRTNICNCIRCVVLYGRLTVNDELEMTWKENVAANTEVLLSSFL
jgi:hypothetical protein